MNSLKIAAAFRLLAEAYETPAETADLPPAQPAAEKPKRGRGRPVVGEETAPAAAQTQTAASPAISTPVLEASAQDTAPENDPFTSTPEPSVPTVTLEQLSAKARELSKLTSQEKAVGIMKSATGAASFGALKPEQYGLAYQAFEASISFASSAKEEVPDPFAAPATTAQSATASATAEAAPSLADVKDAVVKAQKRTGTDVVQKVVAKHGGVAGSPPQVSLKALPVSKYAQVLAEIAALPSTK